MFGIRVSAPGGPEVMEYGPIDLPSPGAGEALISIDSIGVNFIDVYHRSGLYPLRPPFTPGSEGAGTVAEVGPGVTEVRSGDRVAFIHVGSYADQVIVPVTRLVPLPEGIDARTAAATLLQGVTGQYLTSSTFPIQGGEKVLVQAAAGGAGAMIVQMAKRRGAYVFGTASTAKLEVAKESGVDRVIDYTVDRFDEVILDETGGLGVDVVYDSVGQTTFERSLNVLRPRGMLVMFGQSSGPVAPFDILRLSKGSHFLTRPTLAHHIGVRDELLWRANELFDAIVSGEVRFRIDRQLSLREVGEAHRLLEGRATAGKILLAP